MIKVLLVEDQNPYLYVQLLQAQNGFEFIVCKRGDHALQEFREHQPALVLMDIRLPKMDGIQAVRQIRQIDKLTPIIVLTAYATRDKREQALAAGASAFFAKPFNYARLYRRMVELSSYTRPDEHVRRLIANKQRRLQALEEKRAIFGISTPAEILLEIEDLQAELEELNAQQRS